MHKNSSSFVFKIFDATRPEEWTLSTTTRDCTGSLEKEHAAAIVANTSWIADTKVEQNIHGYFPSEILRTSHAQIIYENHGAVCFTVRWNFITKLVLNLSQIRCKMLMQEGIFVLLLLRCAFPRWWDSINGCAQCLRSLLLYFHAIPKLFYVYDFLYSPESRQIYITITVYVYRKKTRGSFLTFCSSVTFGGILSSCKYDYCVATFWWLLVCSMALSGFVPSNRVATWKYVYRLSWSGSRFNSFIASDTKTDLRWHETRNIELCCWVCLGRMDLTISIFLSEVPGALIHHPHDYLRVLFILGQGIA